MKTTIQIDPDGNLHCLYTDDIDLFAIGKVVDVRKASNVNFNEEKQVWEIITLDGQVVYKHANREAAIAKEIELFSPGGIYYDNDNK